MKKSVFFIRKSYMIIVLFLFMHLSNPLLINATETQDFKSINKYTSILNNIPQSSQEVKNEASNNSSSVIDFRQGFAKLLSPLMPAVVNISTKEYSKSGSGQSSFDDFDRQLLERFGFHFKSDPSYDEDYGKKNKSATAFGSGFVVDATGYIVTNHHVIDKADEINVKFNDGKEYSAKLIGSDTRTDIALLKIESKTPLSFVKFGDSKLIQVGDAVLAVGNPFGLGGSATFGIISAISRDILTENKAIVDDYIQIDAAINMGNSGGPTFNMNGEVIGVNAMIYSTSISKGNLGIGFAIPCNTVKKVIEELKKSGKINRGFLGVGIQDATKDLVGDEFPSDDVYGVLVRSVETNSAAYKAGLKPGDIIIEFEGNKVSNSRKLQILVADTPVNSKVNLVVLRDKVKVKLTTKLLSDASLEKSTKEEKIDGNSQNSISEEGVEFKNIDNEIRSKWNLSSDTSGVIIDKIKRNSAWAEILQPGNIIIANGLNKEPIKNISDLNNFYLKALKAKKKNFIVTLSIKNNLAFISLPISANNKK